MRLSFFTVKRLFLAMVLTAAGVAALSSQSTAQTQLWNSSRPDAPAVAPIPTTPVPVPSPVRPYQPPADATPERSGTAPALTPTASPTASPTPAPVTASPQGAAPSQTSLQYAKLIANACPGQWESQACLSAVSASNLALAANYGGALQERGMNAAAEQIKQHCAASTAAREQQFPAYAMKSAFTECANEITTAVQQTGIEPDASHYQLLILPIMCLNKDPVCAQVSGQLAQYK